MPRTKVYSREEILRAAAEVVRKSGTVNARSVAKELGCSTQPVYSEFENMEDLKSALMQEAFSCYHNFIEQVQSEAVTRYQAFGLGFVRFAREEKGLFRFMYLRERDKNSPPLVEDPYLDDIISEMMTLYGMDEGRARAFHADMAVYSYGLGMLVCTGYFNLTDEEVAKRLTREFLALYAYYFPERPSLIK